MDNGLCFCPNVSLFNFVSRNWDLCNSIIISEELVHSFIRLKIERSRLGNVIKLN